MTGAAIGLRRLASQRVLGQRLERPADVVRWLGAVQAQDYGQALWAIGARLRRGTAALVEEAIEDRQIVRTWLMRGTIHFAPPEDVRWLLALCAPRVAVSAERRRAQLGITTGELDRSREVDRRGAGGRPAAHSPRRLRAAAGRGRSDDRRPRVPHPLRPRLRGARLHRTQAGQAAHGRPARRLGSASRRARSPARGGARRPGRALRREPCAGDRSRLRDLGGHHARRCPPRSPERHRPARRARAGRRRVLAPRRAGRCGYAAGRAPARVPAPGLRRVPPRLQGSLRAARRRVREQTWCLVATASSRR